MMCERCRDVEATIHLTEIIKDVKSEIHLCESCARDIGLNAKLSNFSLSVPEMLSFLDINELEDDAAQAVCRTCGLTFLDYSRDGKLGCSDCYLYLKESLRTIIAGYHGTARHLGKHPLSLEEIPVRSIETIPDVPRETIDTLKARLQQAVIEERYEEAAVLRDRIRDYERIRNGEHPVA